MHRWPRIPSGRGGLQALTLALSGALTAQDVARAIVRCAHRPRPEVYPHAPSRALALLNVLAPRFTDRFVKKFARSRDAV